MAEVTVQVVDVRRPGLVLVVLGLCSAACALLALRFVGSPAAVIAGVLTLLLVGRWKWRTAQMVLRQDGVIIRRRHRSEQFATRPEVQLIGDPTPPWREIRIDNEAFWVPMAHDRSVVTWYEGHATEITDP